MATPADFLKEARRHLGERERADGSTPYGVWFAARTHHPEFRTGAWCDMFLSYCGHKVDAPVGMFAWTVAHAKWFQQRGRFNRNPRRGSLVFFDWSGSRKIDNIDHVGVVEHVRDDGLLVTIEGNTDDRVARRVRSMNSVVGFGHPEWEKKPVTQHHRRRFRLVCTTRFGGVRYVYRQPHGGYSWKKGKKGRIFMDAGEVELATKWAKRQRAKTTRVLTPGQYSHLRLDPSTRWPLDKQLLRRLNRIGQRRKRIIWIKSGHRTMDEQWGFWNHYQKYGYPKAAYPNANAPHVRGVAADVGILDRRGQYRSLGLDARAKKIAEKLGLRAWVSGEPWHYQREETY